MKNKFEIKDNIVYIEIKHKNAIIYTTVDEDDLYKILKYNTTWHIHINPKYNRFDGIRTKIQKKLVRIQIWLHHEIIGKQNGKIVDHINGNVLDNRKCNLRFVTTKENASNKSRESKNKTGFRNIYLEKGRYRVRINNKSFGSYTNIEEANERANKERLKIFPLSR